MVNSYNRRGISTIVGGMIFLVLLSGGFSAFYVALDVQKDTISTQRDISKSIVEKTLEKFEISTGTNPVDNTLEIQVENQGVNPVEITNIWIINRSSIAFPPEFPPYTAQSIDVDYEDAFISPGFGNQILEKTPLTLSPGVYDIKVVSALGTIVTEKKFDPNNPGFGEIGDSTGNIFMDFSSFEFCIPENTGPPLFIEQDCTSASPEWTTAWDGFTSTEYLWRITIANRGDSAIIVEKTTALLALHAQTSGGGNAPTVFFIKADSTLLDEDPGAFIAGSKIIPEDGTAVTLYFGLDDFDGSATLESTGNSDGIYAVFLLIFGYQDVNENGIYDLGEPPYSQNLSFQGLRLTDP
jgi:hypothetical protein